MSHAVVDLLTDRERSIIEALRTQGKTRAVLVSDGVAEHLDKWTLLEVRVCIDPDKGVDGLEIEFRDPVAAVEEALT